MSYNAIIARLENVRKHSNADRLQVATVCGEQVIVGLNHTEGELGVYFPTDGQLSEEFAAAHDLIQRMEDGKRAGGFFSKNRHVRAQNFRGERSNGFWMPVSCLEITGPVAVEEGFEFADYNGVPICRKYVTLATTLAYGRKLKSARDNPYFPKHTDTKHLKRCKDLIQPGDRVIITEKLHGTSARVGNVLTEVPAKRPWLGRFFDWLLGLEPITLEYRLNVGTRNTVLRTPDQQGFYGDESFRWKSTESFRDKLAKGEVIYGELVGYTETGRLIMGAQDAREIDQFGDVVEYTYGCEPGECKFFVYRIVENGTELTWDELVDRCKDLGIPTVPYIDSYTATYQGECYTDVDLVPPQSTIDPSHPLEGYAYRIERNGMILKDKTYLFSVLEGHAKSQDTYVDTEESA